MKNRHLGVEQYLSTVPITSETNFLDISTAEDSHLVNDLIYYMNYSLAIFGWPMQMVDDPCMLCCIYPYLDVLRCCGQRKGRGSSRSKKTKCNSEVKSNEKDSKGHDCILEGGEQNNSFNVRAKESVAGQLDENCNAPIILEDNCCGCNVASVERRLRAHNYEIIYVTYRVKVNVVPFLVAADHSKQTIVVAIRGSMGLSDMVTDMNGQTDKLPIDDCPDNWLCHRGITRASEYIRETLKQECILERAFNCRPDLATQDYKLVLCGHSLGAGVAAILGILMRKQYPSLKAYLYSPPGGILSLPAVQYTKQFATGIILGNDCVPRLGVAQLERLRYHVLLSLRSSKKSTCKILTKAMFPNCCLGGNKVDYDPSQSLNLLHGSEGRSFDYNGSKIPFQVQPQVLYVPGRLIHIVKNHAFKSKARRIFNEPIYQAVWNDNTVYDRIMVTENMFYDHLPNNLMHAMKMLFSKTLPAKNDSRASANQDHSSENRANPSESPISDLTVDKPEALRQPITVIKREDPGLDEIKDENNNTEGSFDFNHDNNNIKSKNVGNSALDLQSSKELSQNIRGSCHNLAHEYLNDKTLDGNGNDVAVLDRNDLSSDKS